MSIFKEAIQINAPGKSKFDLSHERKFSCEMGKLVPIMCQEILPGDSFRVNSELMVRFAPLLAPLMHRIDVFTHYFFVPNRIVWNEWETFITGGPDGLAAPVHPAFDNTNGPMVPGTLDDYLGIPSSSDPLIGSPVSINALPHRAYLEIYNEYYRDENLIAPVAYSKGSGLISGVNPDAAVLKTLRTRAWEKDYYTTALPFAQKGAPAGAPVDYLQGTSSKAYSGAANTPSVSIDLATDAAGNVIPQAGGPSVRVESEASVLITEIRKAARLQEFLEAAARGGHRLTEWILHVFGVKSSDARLQRPEYLGGGKTPISISEVLSNFQFSGDAEGQPQGHMAGHGIGYGETHGFERSFEEHGFVIGIMSVMPKANYYQGLERFWTRPSRFDYYIPQFAHLGEQEVKNQELFLDTSPAGQAANNLTFGYQSRYAEYKFKLSTIHGAFRDSLAYWHMARKFATHPGLNQTFIECVPTKDIFPVILQGDNPLYCQVYHDVSAIRPLPYFSNPKL